MLQSRGSRRITSSGDRRRLVPIRLKRSMHNKLLTVLPAARSALPGPNYAASDETALVAVGLADCLLLDSLGLCWASCACNQFRSQPALARHNQPLESGGFHGVCRSFSDSVEYTFRNPFKPSFATPRASSIHTFGSAVFNSIR